MPSPASARDSILWRTAELICPQEALGNPARNPVSQTPLAMESHLLPLFSLEHTTGNPGLGFMSL